VRPALLNINDEGDTGEAPEAGVRKWPPPQWICLASAASFRQTILGSIVCLCSFCCSPEQVDWMDEDANEKFVAEYDHERALDALADHDAIEFVPP